MRDGIDAALAHAEVPPRGTAHGLTVRPGAAVREARPTAPGRAVARVPVPGCWVRRSTSEVPASDRFEFCRGLALGAHAERPLRGNADFFGEFAYTVGVDGTGFAEIDIDPCVSRFGPDGGGDAMVDIALLCAGTMHVDCGRDERLVLSAGAGPVLFDAARPMTIESSRTEFAILRLPRIAVTLALGGDVVPRGGAVRPLPPGALTAGLAACLRDLRDGAGRAAPVPRAAMETAQALALVGLARFRGSWHHWPGELALALYRAACHMLALRAGDARTTAAEVAQVLGCSRAQLYRCFAARGESVAGYLHEVRMHRAATWLRTRTEAAIATIASECGYVEPAAFGKAFRRHFGMTPRDWRAAGDIRGTP